MLECLQPSSTYIPTPHPWVMCEAVYGRADSEEGMCENWRRVFAVSLQLMLSRSLSATDSTCRRPRQAPEMVKYKYLNNHVLIMSNTKSLNDYVITSPNLIN